MLNNEDLPIIEKFDKYRLRVVFSVLSINTVDKKIIISYNSSTKNVLFLVRNEVLKMLAVKSMDVRDNFKTLCDKVFNGETLIISRPKNENVVMLSETEYNEIMKAKRNAEYLAMIDKSMAEAENGGVITKTIGELEAYE